MKTTLNYFAPLLLIFVFVTFSGCHKSHDSENGIPIDGDGNIYDTIVIGTQIWMAENLKTTTFNNGAPIPLITDNTAWASTLNAAYCWYNNDPTTYKEIFGALYNWYAVDTKILCPKGWHVPTGEEWSTLLDYLGGASVAGGKMKETGFVNWLTPNEGATNVSRFTARGTGYRFYLDGTFMKKNIDNYLWSSTETTGTIARRVGISYGVASAGYSTSTKPHGFSVRCLKDN